MQNLFGDLKKSKQKKQKQTYLKIIFFLLKYNLLKTKENQRMSIPVIL